MQKLKLVKHPLLSDNALKILAQNRITTVLEFLQEDTERLSIISKLNITQVLTIRSFIFSQYSAPLVNGTTLLNKSLLEKKYIKTGITNLDTLLGGGIPVGQIAEFFGLSDSGKTQLCLQLSINCVKETDNTVLYINTKGDFSAIRVQKILDSYNLSHKEMAIIMFKIKVVHVWKMEEIIELLQNIKNKTVKLEHLSLIFIDSLPCLMFQYLGDSNKIGLGLLNLFVNYCRFLCKEMNISVICTNIQTRWVDQDVSDLEDDKEQTTSAYKETSYIEKLNRCLGNYWRYVPTVLLLIEKAPCSNLNGIHNIFVTNMRSCCKENNKCVLKLTSSEITSQ